MYKSLLYLTFLFFWGGCDENNVIIEKVCDEEPTFINGIYSISLKLTTDTICATTIGVDRTGKITANNIFIKNESTIKTAKIGGHFCNNLKYSIDVIYTDSTDNSRLRIEGSAQQNLVTGKIYYCPNTNNNCSFTQIGIVSGSYSSGYNSAGSFYTPLFNGEFQTGYENLKQ